MERAGGVSKGMAGTRRELLEVHQELTCLKRLGKAGCGAVLGEDFARLRGVNPELLEF